MRVLLVLALALSPSLSSIGVRGTNEQPLGSELSTAQVTVYGATWCSACKSLDAALRARGIPFVSVDVDENPGAFSIAKKATGTNAIPITNVVRGPHQSWIVGANADAVEKAYRGDS